MNKYKKELRPIDTKHGWIDVYSVLDLFEVESHGVAHAIKKLLMAGKRGAKDYKQDLHEAIMSIERVTDDINDMPEGATHYDEAVDGWYKLESPGLNVYLSYWCRKDGYWHPDWKNPSKEIMSNLTKVEDL